MPQSKYHKCSLECVKELDCECTFECRAKAVAASTGEAAWDKPLCHEHLQIMDERYGAWEDEQVEMHSHCQCECAICNPDNEFEADTDGC